MNQPDTFTHELEEQLHALADGVGAPAVPLGDDLARGRTARRRHRLATSSALLAVVAVVGLGAVGVDQLTGDTSSLAPGGGSRGLGVTTQQAESLAGYNDVLAERLDPERGHLQRFTTDPGIVEYTRTSTGAMLGSTFVWATPGQDAAGTLRVQVATNWEDVHDWEFTCPDGQCESAVTPAGQVARTKEADGVQMVAVPHADGHVVALFFDTRFGDLSQDELIDAAADERLVLPSVE